MAWYDPGQRRRRRAGRDARCRPDPRLRPRRTTNQVATIDARGSPPACPSPSSPPPRPTIPAGSSWSRGAGRILALDLARRVRRTDALPRSLGPGRDGGGAGVARPRLPPAIRGQWPLLRLSLESAGDSEIREYRAAAGDPNRADPASGRLILRIDQPDGLANHKGGWLGFGPDGSLVATGDGGGGGDPLGNGQNPGTLLARSCAWTSRGTSSPPTRRATTRSRRQPLRRRRRGAPGEMGPRAAQPLARLLRPRHRRDVDRRCRPGRLGGDRPRRPGRELRLEYVEGFGALRGGRRGRRTDAAALRLRPGARRRRSPAATCIAGRRTGCTAPTCSPISSGAASFPWRATPAARPRSSSAPASSPSSPAAP